MRVALALWASFWAWVGIPWRSFSLSPSLERVALIPFSDGSPRTQILNLLVFVPLGFIAARMGWSPRMVVLIGAGASVITELLQLFSMRRHPSVTDLILNTAGTLIGILLASSLQGSERVG